MKELSDLLEKIKPRDVAIIGIPFDENSSFMKGVASAPQIIRKALHSDSSNMSTESMLELGSESRIVDLGDIKVKNYIENIEQTVSSVLEKDALVLTLGGDHSITYPILKAYGERIENLNILQLDAHPDLYNEFDGNPFSHGSPFARIMEENLAVRLVQMGIRTMNSHQYRQARRFDVETIHMRDWDSSFKPDFIGPVYLSVDMDVLDPAFAPGVSHHEPGGLSTRDVLKIIQNIDAPVVGADIVELNPDRDPLGLTAMAAAKFLKEIIEKMLSTKQINYKM